MRVFSTGTYPSTPLYAFQRNVCSSWVTLANGQTSYLYLQVTKCLSDYLP